MCIWSKIWILNWKMGCFKEPYITRSGNKQKKTSKYGVCVLNASPSHPRTNPEYILYISAFYKLSLVTTVFDSYSHIFIFSCLRGQIQISKWQMLFTVAAGVTLAVTLPWGPVVGSKLCFIFIIINIFL